MKKTKLGIRILAFMLAFSLLLPSVYVQAGELSEPVITRGEVLDVPDYYYVIEDYDGGAYLSPTVYKTLTVPSGHYLVSHGPSVKSIEYGAYYNGIRRQCVTKYVHTYSFQRM